MSGLAKSLPRLLKIGAVTALSCLALGHTPKQAQAQTEIPQIPTVKLGISQLGPAPISDAPRPHVCWSPGTPGSVIAAYERENPDDDSSLRPSPFRTLFNGRWSRTATNGPNLLQGQPTTLTYSFLPEGLAIADSPGNPNSPSVPNNLNARFNAIYGSQAAWRELFVQVANSWSARSGLNIVLEPNDDGAAFGPQSAGILGVRGDIRIGGRFIDGDGTGGFSVLAYNYAPDFGDMVIDTADSFFTDVSSNSLNFRNVATHEFGHGLGLGHTCPVNETKLMEPIVTRRFDGPQFDDITGIQRFYGDGDENNDTGATATALGTIGEQTVTRNFLSIDAKTDQDYFQLAVPINKSVSITVRPIGTPYQEGPQDGGPQTGGCTPGTQTLFDPRAQNNLGFQLSQSQNGGFVPLSTTDAQPIGGTETLAPTNITRSGALQIRVFGDSSEAQADVIQMYAIDITVSGPVTTPTPTPGPTAGPTPTPRPTALPTPTPGPPVLPIRPVVDLNGRNDDESTGQDSPIANGIDNVSYYIYPLEGEFKTQVITPPETLVIADITADSNNRDSIERLGRTIVEARIELTPDVACGFAGGQGTAPDNCNPQGQRDNEVLGVTAGTTKFLDDNGTGITSSYDINSQVLTFRGANTARWSDDAIRSFYQRALQGVTYLNKLPIPNSPFARQPQLNDRVITYTVDTDNDATNNVDVNARNRFAPEEGPGSNQAQSRVADLTLRFVREAPRGNGNTTVTTLRDVSDSNDGLTSLREAVFTTNQNRGGVIRFNISDGTLPGTINLLAPLPVLRNGADILGPGARLLTIRSTGTGGSVFSFAGIADRAGTPANGNNPATPVVPGTSSSVSGLTITNGSAVGSSEPDPRGPAPATPATPTSPAQPERPRPDIFIPARGGGLNKLAGGNLTVTNCVVSGNTAEQGGGIAARFPGTLTVVSTLVNGNTSTEGGGAIYVVGRPKAVQANPPANPPVADPPPTPSFITNSTISSNNGGGIVASGADMTVSLATVAQNQGFGLSSIVDRYENTFFPNSFQPGPPANDPFNYGNSIVTVSNTIASSNAGNQDVTGSPTFASGGYNIIGGGNQAAAFNATGDRVGITGNAAGLGVLTDNGGNSDTHALRAGSPAINGGDPALQSDANPATAPRNDQRGPGFDRVRFGTIDVGAFERQNNNPIASVILTPRNPGTNDTLTATPTTDGGTVSYEFRVNGTVVQNGASDTLNLATPSFGDRGDVITVLITVTNGAGSTTATDSVTVVNTPPTFTVTLVPRPNPDAPRPNGPLTNDRLEAVTNAVDADNDRVEFSYSWQVNGLDRPQEVSRFLNLSSPGNGNRDDLITVRVTATDRQPNTTTSVQTASTRVANSAPVVTNQVLTVPPGTTGSILLRGTDPDLNDVGTLRFAFENPTNPATGTTPPTLETDKGTATITSNGDGFTLNYTAKPNATGSDLIRITATDTATANSAAITSVAGTVLIKISDPNRPPAVASTSLNARREVPVSINLGASDPDPGDTYANLTLKRVSGPRKGTGEIVFENGAWKLKYKASGLYTGNDEVKFVAIDKQGAVSPVGTITINLFNSAPTARSTQMRVAAGGSADVGIFGTDADRDQLTFKSVGGPTKGTGEFITDSNGNTRFFYQNSPSAVGDDQVRFVAIDSNGTPSEIAILDIKVIGFFNRAPSADNVTGTTLQNTSVAVPVSGTDPDEDDVLTLTFKRVGGPVNGTGEIRKDLTDDVFKMFYTPRADFVGTETIRYVALDKKGRPSAPATITITVTASGSAALRSGPAPSAGGS